MTAPSSPVRRALRRARGVALAGATVAATLAVAAAPARAEPDHDPVLFVHGFTRTSADFDDYKARYVQNGWDPSELFTIDYNSFAPNAYTATLIAAKVDQIRAQTGAAKVDIVAHSMGSYGSRYYLKYLGGAAKVDAWVSISGPNHGTAAADNAQCLAIPSCAEMVPGSSFLTALNSGDETPGDVRYFTLWSQGDDLVLPPQSTELDGATNWENEEVLAHLPMLFDEETIVHTRNFVR